MAKLTVAHIVIMMILLNISAGIVQTAIVDVAGDQVFDGTSQSGHVFGSDNYSDDFNVIMQEQIEPSGSTDDASDQIARVLDMMSLGFISKFLDTIEYYMYGFTTMLYNIMEPIMDNVTRESLLGDFGVLNIIFTISYVLFGIQLFTGRNVLEGI